MWTRPVIFFPSSRCIAFCMLIYHLAQCRCEDRLCAVRSEDPIPQLYPYSPRCSVLFFQRSHEQYASVYTTSLSKSNLVCIERPSQNFLFIGYRSGRISVGCSIDLHLIAYSCTAWIAHPNLAEVLGVRPAVWPCILRIEGSKAFSLRNTYKISGHNISLFFKCCSNSRRGAPM